MAHMIMETDHLMLANTAAWHGIGTVVADAVEPEEALKLAKLDWEVGQDKVLRFRNGSIIESHVENYRMDNLRPLGVVGAGYSVVQNRRVAQFAYSLAKAGDITKVETAGSMDNGRRVWFLIRANSFNVATPKDEVGTYIALGNSHDGSMKFLYWFTSTRIVCNNTFNLSLGLAKTVHSFRHEGDVELKLEDAARTLDLYNETQREYAEACNAMAKVTLTKDQVNDFVMDAITITDGDIVTREIVAAATKQMREKLMKKRDKQVGIYKAVMGVLGRESETLRALPNLWTTFNAVTNWQQHSRPVRAKDDAARTENRVFNNQFGTTPQSANMAGANVFRRALALVK